MALPIHTLRVDNFRAFQDFSAGPFGRVNLITGKNNSGKSSLLEAIRVFATEGATSTFDSIVTFREEADSGSALEPDNDFPREGPFPYSSLFFGFPSLLECATPFTIANRSEKGSDSISARVGWFIREHAESDPEAFVWQAADPTVDPSAVPMLQVTSSKQERERRTRIYRRIRTRFDRVDSRYSCIYLDPSSSRTTDQLASLWDAIALTDEERHVVSALQILDPDIEAVSLIGGDTRIRPRTAIVKSRKFQRPVPLRSLGDGSNRIFAITLCLTAAKSGVLLVDEIENGLHHSVLEEVWRLIFLLAESLDVQVFATTHSWNCIEAFQKAASSHAAEGVLARLSLVDGGILSTLFRENELRIATRDRIEVR